jgi:hypothetical protein
LQRDFTAVTAVADHRVDELVVVDSGVACALSDDRAPCEGVQLVTRPAMSAIEHSSLITTNRRCGKPFSFASVGARTSTSGRGSLMCARFTA